jgi:LacI family transcriptional regulator
MKRTTIQDVAEKAGVSLSTVSRVLNDNPSVSIDLQQRVLDAIKILNYQPNRSAQRLRSQNSRVIGLVISDIENPFFTSIVRGVEDVAYNRQMNVILCNTDENPEKERRYIEVMSEERVAGLIITPTYGDKQDILIDLQASGIPVVLLDRDIESDALDTVLVDNISGAYTATKHLIDLAYERIAIVNGEPQVKTFSDRFKGYQKALIESGVKLDQSLVCEVSPRIESSLQATQTLLKASPDAIFAANNLMTLGVLKAIKAQGLRVPEDVALIGFDDMPWSGDLYPPITSVAQPTYELGREAARLLIRRMSDENVFQQKILLQTRLIVRQSCGAYLRKDH